MQDTAIHKQTVKELLDRVFEGKPPLELPISLDTDEFERLEEVSDELGQMRLLIDTSEECDDLDDLEWAIIETQSWV